MCIAFRFEMVDNIFKIPKYHGFYVSNSCQKCAHILSKCLSTLIFTAFYFVFQRDAHNWHTPTIKHQPTDGRSLLPHKALIYFHWHNNLQLQLGRWAEKVDTGLCFSINRACGRQKDTHKLCLHCSDRGDRSTNRKVPVVAGKANAVPVWHCINWDKYTVIVLLPNLIISQSFFFCFVFIAVYYNRKVGSSTKAFNIFVLSLGLTEMNLLDNCHFLQD